MSGESDKKQMRVLITGCKGQIGSELVRLMRERYGKENVFASDVVTPTIEDLQEGPFVCLDVLDRNRIRSVVMKEKITCIIHNAALVSAVAEKLIETALALNTTALHNILFVASEFHLKVFIPSSIAAFGPQTPLDMTPNLTLQRPVSAYGVGKVYAELMGEYFTAKRGVDFRSLRFPGIISWKTAPGGGTTDYAIDIFYSALKGETYTCFLKDDEMLPMMYMPDCLKSVVDILEADESKLKCRTYNVTAFSFSPAELADAIRKYIPDFKVVYEPDWEVRQKFAHSWPNTLDDSEARKDWSWNPSFTLDDMVKDMLKNLNVKLGTGRKFDF